MKALHLLRNHAAEFYYKELTFYECLFTPNISRFMIFRNGISRST